MSEGRKVGRHGRDADSRIHRGQILGRRSPSGATERTDAIGNDVRACAQIVDASDPVREPVASDVVADEQPGLIRVFVISATFQLGFAKLVVPAPTARRGLLRCRR